MVDIYLLRSTLERLHNTNPSIFKQNRLLLAAERFHARVPSLDLAPIGSLPHRQPMLTDCSGILRYNFSASTICRLFVLDAEGTCSQLPEPRARGSYHCYQSLLIQLHNLDYSAREKNKISKAELTLIVPIM